MRAEDELCRRAKDYDGLRRAVGVLFEKRRNFVLWWDGQAKQAGGAWARKQPAQAGGVGDRRQALAVKSPEARKETSRKAAETRRRNREAAKGEAPG